MYIPNVCLMHKSSKWQFMVARQYLNELYISLVMPDSTRFETAEK